MMPAAEGGAEEVCQGCGAEEVAQVCPDAAQGKAQGDTADDAGGYHVCGGGMWLVGICQQQGAVEGAGVQGGLEGGQMLRQDAVRIQPQGDAPAAGVLPLQDDGRLGGGVADAQVDAAPGGSALKVVQEG